MLLFFFYFYRTLRDLHSFPTRRSSDLHSLDQDSRNRNHAFSRHWVPLRPIWILTRRLVFDGPSFYFFWPDQIQHPAPAPCRSEEHTSELQSRPHLVCRLLLEKKKNYNTNPTAWPFEHNHVALSTCGGRICYSDPSLYLWANAI